MGTTDDVRAIAEWFRVHAGPLYERLQAAAPVSDGAVGELGRALEVELPDDFAEYLKACGGSLSFFEYEGLAPARIATQWRMLEEMRADGTFDAHELFDDDRGFIQRVKWHPGWVPFAEDGGGNLFCMDLAPGPNGVRGQVIRWEVAGGPAIGRPRAFAEYLADYRRLITGGKYVFDRDSYTFDGPWSEDQLP